MRSFNSRYEGGVVNSDVNYVDFCTNPAPKPKKHPRAYCTSQKCFGENYYKLGRAKYVAKTAVYCPDCKSALYWTTEW